VKSFLSNEAFFVSVVLCLIGSFFIFLGLFLPVMDDLSGPSDSEELQSTSPILFWVCVTISVLPGAFLLICGICMLRREV
jgi:hypothetical protein